MSKFQTRSSRNASRAARATTAAQHKAIAQGINFDSHGVGYGGDGCLAVELTEGQVMGAILNAPGCDRDAVLAATGTEYRLASIGGVLVVDENGWASLKQ